MNRGTSERTKLHGNSFSLSFIQDASLPHFPPTGWFFFFFFRLNALTIAPTVSFLLSRSERIKTHTEWTQWPFVLWSFFRTCSSFMLTCGKISENKSRELSNRRAIIAHERKKCSQLNVTWTPSQGLLILSWQQWLKTFLFLKFFFKYDVLL